MSTSTTVPNTTVSSVTRSSAWDLMLDLERQMRYYRKLGDRYQLRYRANRYILLFSILAEGAIIFFLAEHPPYLWTLGGLVGFIIGFVIGFVTIFDASTNYAETSAQLRSTRLCLDDLLMDAESLWRDIEAQRIGDDDAEKIYKTIVKQWARATRVITVETHGPDNSQAARESAPESLPRKPMIQSLNGTEGKPIEQTKLHGEPRPPGIPAPPPPPRPKLGPNRDGDGAMPPWKSRPLPGQSALCPPGDNRPVSIPVPHHSTSHLDFGSGIGTAVLQHPVRRRLPKTVVRIPRRPR